VASAVGTVHKPEPFLFRNYNYHPRRPSRHAGTSTVPLCVKSVLLYMLVVLVVYLGVLIDLYKDMFV
jgi:hypothetical protein